MKHSPLWSIDLLGGIASAGLLYFGVWYAFLRPETASGRLPALSVQVQQGQEELRRLQFAVQEKETNRDELAELSRERGRLPSKSPIEQDLRKIADLASANDVGFEEVLPLAEVRYPNVLEQRFRVRAVGTYASHLRFLHDLENCSFWADVTQLKLQQPSESLTEVHPTLRSSMIVSFFSAVQ